MIEELKRLLKENPPGRPGSIHGAVMKKLRAAELEREREQIALRSWLRKSRHDDMRAEREYQRLFPIHKPSRPPILKRMLNSLYRRLAFPVLIVLTLVTAVVLLDLIK